MLLRGGILRISYKHRITDQGGDKAYACWEADCFSPVVWFVRADSWEEAYERFVDTLPEVTEDDPNLEPEDKVALAKGETPTGYDFTSSGALVYTETATCCNIFGTFD